MTLEDFEKSLTDANKRAEQDRSVNEVDRRHRKHHHHHHHKRKHDHEGKEDERGHKRSRRSEEHDSRVLVGNKSGHHDGNKLPEHAHNLKRDSWMESPSALDVDYVQNGMKDRSELCERQPSKSNSKFTIDENEFNKHHTENLAEEQDIPKDTVEEPAHHDVDYVFGDIGSQWRMTKLKGVYLQAEETGRTVEDVAADVYGDIRSFDDAREEQVELERRDTYGPGYAGKLKPTGELFQERRMDKGVRRTSSPSAREKTTGITEHFRKTNAKQSLPTSVPLDHTALNRLKAQMMKAKLRGSADISRLEAEYDTALAASAKMGEVGTMVLGTMDSRMLAGGRKGEVKLVDNRRGRERGLVEENEDMTIEEMVREERRTRHKAGEEGQQFAERIARDGKFNVSLSLTCILG